MSEGEYLKRYEQVQDERRQFLEWLKANHLGWTFAQQHAAWQAWRFCRFTEPQTKIEE